MVVRGDWARGPAPKKKKSSFTPSPTRVDRVSTPRPPAPPRRNTGLNLPGAYAPAPARNTGMNMPGAYAPAPAPAPYYAPAQIQQGYSPQSFAQSAPAQSFAEPAPYVPPAPPPDTRRRINGKSIKNDEIAELDSTFLDQDAALSEALKKFIADQTEEKGRQKRDTDTAVTGIGRNRKVGLTGMSEDFAARGLQNSGLFMKANADAATDYGRQTQQVRQMFTDNVAKMASQLGKFKSESNATRQSARNEALARLARRSDLVVE